MRIFRPVKLECELSEFFFSFSLLKVETNQLFNAHENSQSLTKEVHKIEHTVIKHEDFKLELWDLLN